MSKSEGPPPFDLKEAFLAKQKELAASLHTGAVVASHDTTKGDDTELNWVSMLASLLPNRYGVAKAHVIDSNGHQSEQLDVVIHDRFFSPLLFDVGGAKFIPAESVYAVFEVKQHLDREYMNYAAQKIASVRTLHRTSLPIPSAMGELQKKDLVRFRIIGGILTPRSKWRPPFGEPFRSCLGESQGVGAIDIGCALDDGGFAAIRDFESEECPLQDVQVSGSDTSLIFFAMRLLYRLQQMGTVPAIDYTEWGAVIPDGG